MFLFSAIYEFKPHVDTVVDVTRGKPVTLVCPPREKEGFGAQYSWHYRAGRSSEVFLVNKRRAITPEGNIHIMYVTEDDIKFIKNVKGIQCRILAAGSYEDSKNFNVKEVGSGWCRYF